MKDMGYKKPRPVSYMNGVFMTAGLNKGIMLKTLLYKTKSKFKAIIFADDHIKHTKRMQQILGDDVDLTTYRYSKIDPQVEAFKNLISQMPLMHGMTLNLQLQRCLDKNIILSMPI
jgi:hypothetical protein